MVWSINYSSTSTGITFNVCADTPGGYFYILKPDSTVLPSTQGGKLLSAGQCTTFTTNSSEYTMTGTHTMVLAESSPTEPTKAQVWFHIVPSPFTVTPASGSSSGGGGGTGYNCTVSGCQVPASGTGTYPDLASCQAACTSPPPSGTCPSTDQINIIGTCVNKKYILYGGVAFGALFLLSLLKK